MNVKMRDLINFGNFYEEIKDIPVNPILAYKLNLIKNIFDSQIKYYRDSLQEIFEKYGERDQNGNLIIEDKEGSIKIETTKIKNAEQEINNLFELTIPIPERAEIQMEELGDSNLTPAFLSNLFPFII